MKNPYITGNPVKGKTFINRQREIRKVLSRVLNGQSVAVVSEPRQGKTSLLEHLKSSLHRSGVVRASGNKKILLHYSDIQTIAEGVDQNLFWSQVFKAVHRQFLTNKSHKELLSAYKICEKYGFTTYNLERLIANLDVAAYHLVLFIDEFDVILFHDGLNKAEFYGGLRSLASRYGQTLTLVIASRLSVSKLNLATQEFSRTGSPYFNFMPEVVLQPFSTSNIDELFGWAGKRFTNAEKDYIRSLAGGHPYLLQVASSALLDAYHESLKPQKRLEQIGRELFRVAEDTISSTWKLWTPEIQKAFVIVALDETPAQLDAQDLDFNELRKVLSDYSPELRYLGERGFIIKDSELPTGWGVGSKIMLWWLADTLTIALRANDDMGQFIRQHQWEGFFSEKEKAQFRKAVRYVSTVAQGGVETFVKAAAEGLGKGLAQK